MLEFKVTAGSRKGIYIDAGVLKSVSIYYCYY